MNIDLSTILAMTWEAMNNPLLVGPLIALLMIFLFRPIIFILFDRFSDLPEVCRERGLAINAVTFLSAFLLLMFRLEFDWGQTFVLSVVSMFVAIGAYEIIKNILGTFGVDLSDYRPFG